jgi:glucose-1-phosphate cytidylyltransferase
MKVVLFCGGLGTRIREYSENVPKPMVPVGQQPILWHLMKYYSQQGHTDFVLCLGYKANIIKEFFLTYKHAAFADCVVSDGGRKVEIIGDAPSDWRVTLVDSGIWRNVGQRLVTVREHVKDEPMFLANYSDGLSDVPVQKMVDFLVASGKTACFLAVRPPLTFHLVEFDTGGQVERIRASQESDIWINAGFFVFTNRIFDYIRDGEELVVEPFRRLIEAGELIAYKHTGFFRAMDTLRDKQVLEEMVERGEMPWLPNTWSVPAAPNPRVVAGA